MAKNKKRPEQKSLKGMEPPMNKKVNAKLRTYVDIHDERMQAVGKEKLALDALISEMQEAGLTEYRDPETQLGITVKTTTKVKIHRGGEDDNGPDAPDADPAGGDEGYN